MRPAQGGCVRCTSFLLTRLRAQSTSLLYILVLWQSHAAAHHRAVFVTACQPAAACNGVSLGVLLLIANLEGAGALASLGKRSVSQVVNTALAAEQVQTSFARKLAHLHRLPAVAACQVVVLGRWCPMCSQLAWWQAGWAFELTSGTISPAGSRCSCTACSRRCMHARRRHGVALPGQAWARILLIVCSLVLVRGCACCTDLLHSLHTGSRNTGSRRRRMSWRCFATSRRCGVGCAAAAPWCSPSAPPTARRSSTVDIAAHFLTTSNICLCATLGASPQNLPDRLPSLHAGDSMGMMEAADGVQGVDLLNLQLGLVDRDFDESDYEVSNLMHAS